MTQQLHGRNENQQPLLQLNFEKKQNKTISTYFDKQINFMRSGNKRNEHLASQTSLVSQSSYAPGMTLASASNKSGQIPTNHTHTSSNWLLSQKTMDKPPRPNDRTSAPIHMQPSPPGDKIQIEGRHVASTHSNLEQLQNPIRASSGIRTTSVKRESSMSEKVINSRLTKRTVSNMRKYVK